MLATVVIITKNRKEELRSALRSAVEQSANPEVLVIDDGSTDGTAEMVAEEFPSVVLFRHDQSTGYIVRRNEGARLAHGDVIVSIDDDATFSTKLVVEQILKEFNDPQIGAVAVPYIEPGKSNRLMQSAPDQKCLWIAASFIGTAHALRRDVFLRINGYREHLIHQGEEGDYCLRMLDAGFLVRLGSSDPIYHFESPKRNLRRMDYYGARNTILFAWQNVPWPILPLHILGTSIRVVCWTFNPRRFMCRLGAVLAGYLWCLRNWEARSPVKRSVYDLARRLRIGGPAPLVKFKE